jgi:DNA primase
MTQELQSQKVITLLNAHLGQGTVHRKGEASYYCPSCNHYKKKLQVNLMSQRWHCWVCGMKGNGLFNLFKKTGASQDLILAAKEINVGKQIQRHDDESVIKQLPSEFRPLHINWNTPHYKNALHYVVNVRGLSPLDILRYNVGYCEEGDYKGMIIIPSYDANNQLNYFVGRSYYDGAFKHKNPTWSKDIIGFENQIDFGQPITLVEGAFDAISTKRNTIPLFGKRIMPTLRQTIITKKVPKLYISLDQDAIESALNELEYYMNSGVEVYFVNLTGKDPNELGFGSMVTLIKNCKQFTFSDLIKHKLAI